MSDTARLGLPMLQPGQAQKEMVHNEALMRIDIASQASVVAVAVNDPPATPMLGACWIVGDAPTGDWAGQARALAGWSEGGWRFVAPQVGFSAWCINELRPWRFDGSTWQVATVAGSRVVVDGESVVRARQPAVADPVGGAVVDVEARSALVALLTRLRAHGLIATD